MRRTVAKVESTLSRLVPNLLFVIAGSLGVARVSITLWGADGVVKSIVGFLATNVFNGEQELILFSAGLYFVFLLLFFLDQEKLWSAVLLSVASVMYVLLLHASGFVFGEIPKTITDIKDGWSTILAGICASLFVVGGHKGLSRGVLNWRRRVVHLSLAAIVTTVTMTLIVDFLISRPEGAGLPDLLSLVMFMYVMGYVLEDRVQQSIVVLGPRRNGKTTFLLGLYKACSGDDDGESHAYPLRTTERQMDVTAEDTTEDPPLLIKSGYVVVDRVRKAGTVVWVPIGYLRSACREIYLALKWIGARIERRLSLGERTYRSVEAVAMHIADWEFVKDRSITSPSNATVPLNEMMDTLHDENEDGWGEYDLGNRTQRLDEPLPASMYVKIGFNVGPTGVPKRRVRIQTVDSSGNHYENLADYLERYRGVSGWFRRVVARATGDSLKDHADYDVTDHVPLFDRVWRWVRWRINLLFGEPLDEFGEYESKDQFDRVLARKAVTADAVVVVLDSFHLLEENEQLEDANEVVRVSTIDYNGMMRDILEKLEETGRARNVILVVTKADLVPLELGPAEIPHLKSSIVQRLDNNPELEDIREFDFDAIHPVYYEMKDDESGPVKPPKVHGFEAVLNSLVPDHE